MCRDLVSVDDAADSTAGAPDWYRTEPSVGPGGTVEVR